VRRSDGMRAEETLAHRVQRARADVAVYDAKRGERQWKEAASAEVRESVIDRRRRYYRSGRVGMRGTISHNLALAIMW
jgi:hypothetical protein